MLPAAAPAPARPELATIPLLTRPDRNPLAIKPLPGSIGKATSAATEAPPMTSSGKGSANRS